MTVLDDRRTVAPPVRQHAPRRRDRSIRGWVRRGGLVTLLFALPMILVFAIYSWWPILQSIWMSFQKTNLITYQFVGFDNFVNVLSDPLLGRAVLNT
ncbi:sugar ABC transporter permease, partial [Schumannella luteola]